MFDITLLTFSKRNQYNVNWVEANVTLLCFYIRENEGKRED